MKKRISIVLLAAILFSLLSVIPALAAYNMPYYIDVDVTNQITTIYSTKDRSIVRQMICSSGINGSTPLGVWHMCKKERVTERNEWTWLGQYRCYVKYATRVHLGYMFHSLPYTHKEDPQPDPEAVAALGTAASHGCIRLRWEDAYFIAKNCLEGTRVNFFESGEVDEQLRSLLMESSYTNEDGMTYNEFLGFSADSLGRNSAGDEVIDLQHRLIDLGYYEGAVTGIYDVDTVTSVKKVQRDLGLRENGVVTAELKEILYSDDAPVSSGNTTLKIGSSGPVVKKFQQALNEIGVYNGDYDGIYDPEVEEAVKLLQGAFGYPADGITTPLMQKIVYYELDQIKEACGENFTVSRNEEESILARVQWETKIIVRSKPSTESSEVGKVKNNDIVYVKATNGDWAQVVTANGSGFIMKKYLNAYKQSNLILNYSGDAGTYTIGHPIEELMNGAQSLAQKYENGIPVETETYVEASIAGYVIVNTGSDDVDLNLRSGPGSDSEALCTVPNGTVLNIEGKENGWTAVTYNGNPGYLMNDYLEIHENSSEEEAEDEAYEEHTTAIVVSETGGADVFKEASADSDKVGALKAGTEVDVDDMGDGEYVLISYQGRGGYMLEKNLQFILN